MNGREVACDSYGAICMTFREAPESEPAAGADPEASSAADPPAPLLLLAPAPVLLELQAGKARQRADAIATTIVRRTVAGLNGGFFIRFLLSRRAKARVSRLGLSHVVSITVHNEAQLYN